MSNSRFFFEHQQCLYKRKINRSNIRLNKHSDKLNVLNEFIIYNMKENVDQDNSSKFEFLHQKNSEVDDQLNPMKIHEKNS